MGRKLLYLFLLITITAQSQIEQSSLFSEAIGKNIKKYVKNSQNAYVDQDFERAEFLFDSLINNVVNGSYLDNFKVRKLSGKKIELYKFENVSSLEGWKVVTDAEIGGKSTASLTTTSEGKGQKTSQEK